ncbi:MAG: HD domain-containing protein [Gammaproteobacteria bacterium]|nr:HD domain-containing protein [Gammaproteobacteria bacterium]
MEESIPLKNGDLQVGSPIGWDVFDRDGNLLLRKGYQISSEKQISRLIHSGLFRQANDDIHERKKVKAIETQFNPFDELAIIQERFESLINNIAEMDDFYSKVLSLLQKIDNLCIEYPDSVLGYIHLLEHERYSIKHALQKALLAGVLASMIEFDPGNKVSLIGAALTANISMMKLQDKLACQSGPLTDEQRESIRHHPVRSIKLLKRKEVFDEEWLVAIYHHHERCNGKGYPENLSADDIHSSAKIVAVCDRYAAAIANREYRSSLLPNEGLKTLFTDMLNEYDEQVRIILIKVLGIYPPGCFVKLANGETAVVIKRNFENSKCPIVASLYGADGHPFMGPIKRDTSFPDYEIRKAVKIQHKLHLPLGKIWGFIK